MVSPQIVFTLLIYCLYESASWIISDGFLVLYTSLIVYLIIKNVKKVPYFCSISL